MEFEVIANDKCVDEMEELNRLMRESEKGWSGNLDDIAQHAFELGVELFLKEAKEVAENEIKFN